MDKKFKAIFFAMMALCLSFGMVSCGGDDNNEPDSGDGLGSLIGVDLEYSNVFGGDIDMLFNTYVVYTDFNGKSEKIKVEPGKTFNLKQQLGNITSATNTTFTLQVVAENNDKEVTQDAFSFKMTPVCKLVTHYQKGSKNELNSEKYGEITKNYHNILKYPDNPEKVAAARETMRKGIQTACGKITVEIKSGVMTQVSFSRGL